MGQTTPTHRQRLQQGSESWHVFERARRRGHREPFQQVLADIHEHVMAGDHLSPPTVEGTALLSISNQP